MLITEILGHISEIEIGDREVDCVELNWWDVRKKIARLTSKANRDVAIKLSHAPKMGFCNGDVLYIDSSLLILVHILPERALCARVGSFFDIARLCYEVGNRQAALFYREDESGVVLYTPYEAPMQRLFDKLMIEYEVRQEILDGGSRLQVSMPHSEPTARVAMSGDFNVTFTKDKGE